MMEVCFGTQSHLIGIMYENKSMNRMKYNHQGPAKPFMQIMANDNDTTNMNSTFVRLLISRSSRPTCRIVE